MVATSTRYKWQSRRRLLTGSCLIKKARLSTRGVSELPSLHPVPPHLPPPLLPPLYRDPLCRPLMRRELMRFMALKAGRVGTYFDGFGCSEHLSIGAAIKRVIQRSRNAMLFFNDPRESLFLFYQGPIWLCSSEAGPNLARRKSRTLDRLHDIAPQSSPADKSG